MSGGLARKDDDEGVLSLSEQEALLARKRTLKSRLIIWLVSLLDYRTDSNMRLVSVTASTDEKGATYHWRWEHIRD